MVGSSQLSRSKLFVVALVAVPAIVISIAACCIENIPGAGPFFGTGTNLSIKNNTGSSIPVLITLGAGYGINNVNQLPASWNVTPYPDGTNIKGLFTLPANATVSFNSGNRSFSGNIAFGPTFAAMGCGGSQCYPNATNLAEFTINFPGETVDISNVNGTNAFIEFLLSGGATWTDNVSPSAISSFANKNIGQNANIPGVYGWQATTCTGNGNPPNPIAGCPAPNNGPGTAELSSSQMCNVQRQGNAPFGGDVTINFNGWTPNSEPPAGCGN